MRTRSTNTLPFFHPASLICRWFGVGLLPVAPGTAGSLAALPFAYLIHIYFGGTGLLAAAMTMFFIGWAACSHYLIYSSESDPKEVVVDEVAGQWVVLSVLLPTWQSYLVGFLLFRFFDVVKPWPISVVDRKMKTALGVMLDDVLAGFYPVLLLLLVCGGALLYNHYDTLEPIILWLSGNHAI